MDAAPGGSAAPRQLTTFEGPDNDPETESRPAWSPDGRSIAYLQGGPLKLIYYAVQKLAVVPAAGGAPRILTAALDRNVANPVWSSDGSSIYFQLEDDRTVGLALVPAAGGAIERHVSGPRVVRSEEHTSELQSLAYLVCRLLLQKKKQTHEDTQIHPRSQGQT